MREFYKVLNFYINSSIHLSIAIVSFAVVTFLNFDLEPDIHLLVFIFLSSITGYNFIKYAGIAKFHHFSLAKNLRIIQIFSFFVFAFLVFFLFFQSVAVLMLAVILGIFTVLYALPVFNKRRNLRAIPGIKIYVIAFVVAGATVLMPLVGRISLLDPNVLITFLQRFFIVIALVLPFEIRDLKLDREQLGTIPQVLGVEGTKKLGYILTVVVVAMEFLKDVYQLSRILSLFVLAVLTFFSVKRSRVVQLPYFASFWVEAVPIAWLASFIILREII